MIVFSIVWVRRWYHLLLGSPIPVLLGSPIPARVSRHILGAEVDCA